VKIWAPSKRFTSIAKRIFLVKRKCRGDKQR